MKKEGSCVVEVECRAGNHMFMLQRKGKLPDIKAELLHFTLGQYNKKQGMNEK